MRVITFQPRFQEPVADGRKKQTIRLRARCKPGDELSLRKWKGKPYRSLQLELRPRTRCTAVKRVGIFISLTVGRFCITVDDQRLTPEETEAFAKADGFTDANDMRAWFEATHELPFDGELIEWE